MTQRNMIQRNPLAVVVLFLMTFLLAPSLLNAETAISGELKKWHRVTLTFDGPETSETADVNPFLDYRLNVTFTHGDIKLLVPGYYAADGNAAETSAATGDKWRVHFSPNAEGEWKYVASFRKGKEVAVSLDPEAGEPTDFNGETGSFRISPTDKTGRDFRGQGLLQCYNDIRYLRFVDSGEFFLKAGADSPENFLAYYEFDGDPPKTKKNMIERSGEAFPLSLFHHYDPHLRDWSEGDPTWKDGRGKRIIGALNYLASKGMNSVYFLTMNLEGDGRDVWPWTTEEDRYRFDCSKLDQWEIVFSHMTANGIMLHVLTQETENDQLIDGGELGVARKLYYRELIARFGHNLAVTWNLGEENTNTTEQQKAFCKYIHDVDPYDHLIVVHTYPNKIADIYEPLLGYEYLTGVSMQTNASRENAIRWIERSQVAGRPWVVTLDEIGPANTGVKPDADDPTHDEVRKEHLWPTLMAGGAGVEWYFGYQHAHNDLNCEDWRSRDAMWDQTRHAIEFFQEHLPFHGMQRCDALTNPQVRCFAKPGLVYALYRSEGMNTCLNLGRLDAEFDVFWYNPREGGELQRGSKQTIKGPGLHALGLPPSDPDKDWAVLVKNITPPPSDSYRYLGVKGGVGEGWYRIGAAVPVKAVSLDPTMRFERWEDGKGCLADPKSPETIAISHPTGVTLEAVFVDATTE